jgi:transglutaminase-like putative cysteine protease
MMGMQFDTIAVDRKTALERHEGPEVFTRTFIDSPRKISAAERRRKLSYLLSGINPESRLVIPQSFEQSSAATSDQIRVTVTPHPLPLGESINTKVGNAAVMPFLLPGAWIQSTASEVAALSATAVNGARYKGEAARRIEEFVSRYMKPSGLETGYASALETLRTRKGDCTEYALLTAALCRAAGIPARIALGLVYAETGHGGRRDFFGGHAWTQVFLDGHWYSLDAALGGFGAGHVAVSYNNGDPENLTALVNAIGNIRILSID